MSIILKLKQVISPKIVENTSIVHPNDSDTDTLKCPKCKALWRAKGHYNYDDGGWAYETVEDDLCPCGCTNFLGFHIKGLVV